MIGLSSQNCRFILMVSTGPSWPTFNVWNRDTPRIILIDHERINITPNTAHCSSVEAVRKILKERGQL